MPVTWEDSGSLQAPLLEEDFIGEISAAAAPDGSEAFAAAAAETTDAEAEVKAAPTELKRSRSRKMSLYKNQSGWSNKSHRTAYMDHLLLQQQQRLANVFQEGGEDVEEADVKDSATELSTQMHSAFVRHLRSYVADGDVVSIPSLEIRVKNFSFDVPMGQSEAEGKTKIPTVFNYSPIYWCKKGCEKLCRRRNVESALRKKQVKSVLSNVNLSLEAGKMYLIIGPPSSGKTSLLNAIGGRLQGNLLEKVGYSPAKLLRGQVVVNNLVCCGDGTDESHRTLFKNMVASVHQIDDHAPRFTVGETLQFSNSCKFPASKEESHTSDLVGLVLEGLGLSHVKDTFVGNEQIRGVSGGQRRRVTLGEMLTFMTPLLLGDEISTGLDAASTVEIVRILSYAARVMNRIAVISLLQPSPEAVALFDEMILLGDGGQVIFAGPTSGASAHFEKLGFKQPDAMDDADFLLAVASADREYLYHPEGDLPRSDDVPTSESLGMEFQKSEEHALIMNRLEREWEQDWSAESTGTGKALKYFHKKHHNSLWTSALLNFKRGLTLWSRNKGEWISNQVIKNINVGLCNGFLFRQATEPREFLGALYAVNMVSIMLSASASVNALLDGRSVFYKHHSSNFYSALSYVVGQVAALVPAMIIDVTVLGSLLYWMVGFKATADAFIIYFLYFLMFNILMLQIFNVFVALAPNKSLLGAACTFTIFFNTVFCGFVVKPDVIPIYWKWLYWILPSPWVYRGLAVNQLGETDLINNGFVFERNGNPFSKQWIGYGFAYLILASSLATLVAAFCLHHFRMEEPQKSAPDVQEIKGDEKDDGDANNDAVAAFTPVNLSFHDLCYEVKASKGSGNLRLLKSVSGIFRSGRMCALMGESGAGKTTLMDVIALRKGSALFRGNVGITGDILLNGFPQEKTSFRRCSGYVEQFDVQSNELTVAETIRFSAQLRLDRTNPIHDSPESLESHIDKIIETLGLTKEADFLVGSDEASGLSFEQKKRLSIAVELAASPSLIFLDEPTSGLDARAALLVVNALKEMADQGRTIVATIHQPSSTVFDMFDDLLLLKKGGEVVYHGELGDSSASLISYFEGLGATPISLGENPSTWMLNQLNKQAITNSEGETESIDFAKAWKKSEECQALQDELDQMKAERDEALQIKSEMKYAQPWFVRDRLMTLRAIKIYWRSPGYNLSRLTVTVAIALLLGSMFIPICNNEVFSEAEVQSSFGAVYIGFIIIGQLSITSIIPVTISIRDMFYRHESAGMLSSRSVIAGLLVAELPFIAVMSLSFPVIFLALVGMPNDGIKGEALRGLGVFIYFGLNTAIYSYIGQMFCFLVPGEGTAIVLANIFIGLNNAYSGFIASPALLTQNIFFAVQYYFVPGRYVYQGMVASLFGDDYTRWVTVPQTSPLFDNLGCVADGSGSCTVTVSAYFEAFFDYMWNLNDVPLNGWFNFVILLIWSISVRFIASIALKYLKYSGK